MMGEYYIEENYDNEDDVEDVEEYVDEEDTDESIWGKDEASEDKKDEISRNAIERANEELEEDSDFEDKVIEEYGEEDEDSILLNYLSPEELDEFQQSNEKALTMIYENEDMPEAVREELLNEVAKRNMKLVYSIANKCNQKFIVPVPELIDAGMLGYAKAFKAFDPTKGNKFATFAFHCIQNEVRFAVRKESKHYQHDESINKTRYVDKNGNNLTVEDILADERLTAAEVAAQNARDLMVREGLNKLSPIEKYVMYTRYGIDNNEELTQKDIAEAVNMSQANISKIERNSIEKLQDILHNVLD